MPSGLGRHALRRPAGLEALALVEADGGQIPRLGAQGPELEMEVVFGLAHGANGETWCQRRGSEHSHGSPWGGIGGNVR